MSLSVAEIESRLKNMLHRTIGASGDAAAIGSDIPLVGKGLALDSVALLEFVVGIEKEFGIQLDDGALTTEHFESIAVLSRFLHGRIVLPQSK